MGTERKGQIWVCHSGDGVHHRCNTLLQCAAVLRATFMKPNFPHSKAFSAAARYSLNPFVHKLWILFISVLLFLSIYKGNWVWNPQGFKKSSKNFVLEVLIRCRCLFFFQVTQCDKVSLNKNHFLYFHVFFSPSKTLLKH